jgi:carboxyl-terminal processing protease
MTTKFKKIGIISTSVLIGIMLFLMGTYYGFSHRPEIEKVMGISNKETTVATNADFEPFWKVWNKINEKSIYVDKATDQERVWGAAQGLASSLGDPYTVFFPPEDNKLFNDTIKGSFGGIGAEIGIKSKILTVVAPIKGSPADKAGLKAGDKIIKIGKTETGDMTVDTAISLIRGEKGTPISLTIFHAGDKTTKEISIIRDTIEIPTIDTTLRDDGVFVISFYSFSENSANLFKDALQKFIDSKSDKLIIDLRGNPGGYLSEAVQIASWFIDQGLPIVREDFGDKKKENIYRSYGPRIFSDRLKLVILVDEGSASASEILAGAIKEHHIGKLVGTQTFGKGSVQELIPITDDTSLKVTVAKWLTPNGVSISDHGLTPDVLVKVGKNDNKDNDTQMNKAVEVLLK